jgi:hypothetical protein
VLVRAVGRLPGKIRLPQAELKLKTNGLVCLQEKYGKNLPLEGVDSRCSRVELPNPGRLRYMARGVLAFAIRAQHLSQPVTGIKWSADSTPWGGSWMLKGRNRPARLATGRVLSLTIPPRQGFRIARTASARASALGVAKSLLTRALSPAKNADSPSRVAIEPVRLSLTRTAARGPNSPSGAAQGATCTPGTGPSSVVDRTVAATFRSGGKDGPETGRRPRPTFRSCQRSPWPILNGKVLPGFLFWSFCLRKIACRDFFYFICLGILLEEFSSITGWFFPGNH